MKRMIRTTALFIIFVLACPQSARAARLLVPGGQLVGLELSNGTVTVAAFDDGCSNARDAGVRIGDQILEVDGRPVSSAEDVRKALAAADGTVRLTLLREGKRHILNLKSIPGDSGPRLGLCLRQGIAGIGTITFYDPDTDTFGTLGHGISDAKGNPAPMVRGRAWRASVSSVRKGLPGDPGQLRGTADTEHPAGELLRNTAQGVFGTSPRGFSGEPLPTAEFCEITPGPAKIRCTVEGEDIREYSVEILKIYPRDRADCRNFMIRVTDPDLLEITGGIVQGMSGSPIIQDGKLVGAVTHVLVNDPTRGYGIFIENMLDAAE